MNNELENAKKHMVDQVSCPAVGYQDVDVCIPVSVKAFGEVGNIKTQCIGKAVVAPGCDHCPGKSDGVCKFTITQKLRVEVPVAFGARVKTGEAAVNCEFCEKEEHCNHCEQYQNGIY